ncbi:MAG: hypothetical protein WC402_04255 [Candidatus Pacearchaeota archaeon]|jgi:hypothetical protein
MERKPLIPKTIINIDGKICYNENNRAWNTIRLKNEILNEFTKLKEKRSSFSYQMIYHRSSEELEKTLKRMKMNKEVLPILMFLYEDRE